MSKNQLTVELLMCNMIHNWHNVKFVYVVKNPDTDLYDDILICEWNDKYYKEHREELYSQVVDYFTVGIEEIKVCLRK